MCEATHVPFNCSSYDVFDLTNDRTIFMIVGVGLLENRNDGCTTFIV